ncbi:cupin domain-containing protein [Oceanobacillus sp. CAU 1775]
MEKYLISDAQQFSEERFTKVNIIRNKRSTAFLLNFLPGQVMKSHNHPERELYLHVIEGNGVFLIDGEELPVQKGDVIYCGEEEQIGFTNTSEANVSIYATMTKMTD